jgi:AF2212-like protein
MRAIRAHFDGRVIIPDEPLELPPQSEVTVLIDQETEEDAKIAEETRKYYESLSAEEKAEDEAWGKGAEHDAGSAWE